MGHTDKPLRHRIQPLNIAGWNSSYTGEPIPSEEMREWVDQTVERILSCGQNVFWKSVVEQVCCYFGLRHTVLITTGTDLTAASIEYLERQIAMAGGFVWERHSFPAEWRRLHGYRCGKLDTVIINSVVQYFPSLQYLSARLDGSDWSRPPGGSVIPGRCP